MNGADSSKDILTIMQTAKIRKENTLAKIVTSLAKVFFI